GVTAAIDVGAETPPSRMNNRTKAMLIGRSDVPAAFPSAQVARYGNRPRGRVYGCRTAARRPVPGRTGAVMSNVRSCSFQTTIVSIRGMRSRNGMLAAERRAKIVEELERLGAMLVMEFADLLGVSDMTIRRDLDLLARRGLVDKVHGGATRRSPSTDEPGFEAKSRRQREEKE